MLGMAHIQTGGKEPVETLIVTTSGVELTGSTNIKCKIRRLSDGKYYDWSDDTFKSSGSVVKLLEALREVSSVSSKGEYILDTLTHAKGWDTTKITNPISKDIYFITVVEDGTSLSGNLPQIGELKTGDWLDYIDTHMSIVSSKIDTVQTTATTIKADTVTISNKSDTIITKENQIISTQALLMIGGNVCVVKQSYAYDSKADTLIGQIWVEKNNAVTTPISTSVTWYDENGLPLFTITDSTPDPQGFFTVQKAHPNFLPNKAYYGVAVVTLPTIGPVISGKGAITVG